MRARELVTITEAARRLARDRRTIRRWITDRGLQPVGLTPDGHRMYDLATIRALCAATPRRARAGA